MKNVRTQKEKNPGRSVRSRAKAEDKLKWHKSNFCDPEFCTVLMMCGVTWISSRSGYYG